MVKLNLIMGLSLYGPTYSKYFPTPLSCEVAAILTAAAPCGLNFEKNKSFFRHQMNSELSRVTLDFREIVSTVIWFHNIKWEIIFTSSFKPFANWQTKKLINDMFSCWYPLTVVYKTSVGKYRKQFDQKDSTNLFYKIHMSFTINHRTYPP